MCSYNPVNGIYSSENAKLLNDVLRKQFGFNGLIMSDWGAVHNPVRAVAATLDLCMPNNPKYEVLIERAIKDGILTEKQIDERVEKVLELIEKSDDAADKRVVSSTAAERHEKAVEIAKEGMVLLKNEENILPLNDKSCKGFIYSLYADEPCISGGGSGKVETDFVQPPLKTLVEEKAEIDVSFMKMIKVEPCWRAVYKQAFDADVTIILAGTDSNIENEGFNRSSIRLSAEQEDSIIRIASRANKTVVVLYAGSAVDMSGWIDCVDAVVFAGFAGEGVNEALSDLLCGKSNFSGKLTETFPIRIEDSFKGGKTYDGETDLYDDGIFVGYRYYDYEKKNVQFPFGFGLSYAKFEYDNLRIERTGDCEYSVSYDITNVSEVAGKEISQVYVKDVSAMVRRPVKELKGFSKDYVAPHETKTVCVKLDYSSFAYYNVSLDKWYAENGFFEIYVGSSSRSLPLKGKLFLELPAETQYSDG